MLRCMSPVPWERAYVERPGHETNWFEVQSLGPSLSPKPNDTGPQEESRECSNPGHAWQEQTPKKSHTVCKSKNTHTSSNSPK